MGLSMGLGKRNWRIPKEHGVWAMIYVPLLLGATAAGAWGVRIVWLAVAATAFLFAREASLAWWRARVWGRDPGNAGRMALFYSVLAAASGVELMLSNNLWGLGAFGAAATVLAIWHARQAARREERTVATEVLGIAGLTLTAPAAHYAALGRFETAGLWIWAASAAYFTSSVFYVKLRVLTAYPKQPGELARIRRWCWLYHAALALAAGAVVAFGAAPVALLLAYTPVLARAFWHLWRPAQRLVLTRVGLLEIAYSVLFLFWAALAFRAQRSGTAFLRMYSSISEGLGPM
jgi:hypothetical protein